ISHVIFQNRENGFTVARFEDIDTEDKFVVVGTFADVGDGAPMRISGEWTSHQKFGRQFKVDHYEMTLPRSKVGITKYLTSFISGVGPVMAKRIVDHFGEQASEIIEKSPERLTEVPGIGKSKAARILKSWEEHSRMKSVMIFLQSYSIGPGVAMKIFNNYGEAAAQVLKQNPYILATEIYGIGFLTADRIAMNLGMEKDAPQRIRAGIAYRLDAASNEGHVYLPRELLVESSAAMLDCDPEKVEAHLDDLLASGDELISEQGRIYSARLHYAETNVASRLAKILKQPAQDLFKLMRGGDELIQTEKMLGFSLSPKQISVINVICGEKTVILTGGPGTGKTVSTRAVIHIFEKNGYRVLLAAPTGRAAKRMTEATGKPSCTIHRLLEYNPRMNIFGKDNDNPLECDLLVVDEMSMVDVMLMYHLLKAVKHHTRLLLVGDADQLPSVGPGNVLRDLISSGAVPTVRLDTIYRQDSGSTIVNNAHLINQGEMPMMAGDKNGNFFFSQQEDAESALDVMLRICTERLPRQFGLDPRHDIQTISPMYRGPLGVDNLNSVLQNKMNPGKDVVCGGKGFRLGDRVMQIKNNYEKEVFNGDIGFVRSIDIAAGELTVDYETRLVKYGFNEADQLVLAYAITVHKSQGSEYQAVVMPVTTQHYTMLQRNLLYTAITRAKRLVVLVGTKKAIAIAVKNNKIEERFTSLGERLITEMEKRTLFDGD
ncbi:MAG TPA: ATP-dependent RecD-like DNA helicase, partial [bacterium]|nr:ATP-dependent RecD-like DNA helicase [bacterium]